MGDAYFADVDEIVLHILEHGDLADNQLPNGIALQLDLVPFGELQVVQQLNGLPTIAVLLLLVDFDELVQLHHRCLVQLLVLHLFSDALHRPSLPFKYLLISLFFLSWEYSLVCL